MVKGSWFWVYFTRFGKNVGLFDFFTFFWICTKHLIVFLRLFLVYITFLPFFSLFVYTFGGFFFTFFLNLYWTAINFRVYFLVWFFFIYYIPISWIPSNIIPFKMVWIKVGNTNNTKIVCNEYDYTNSIGIMYEIWWKSTFSSFSDIIQIFSDIFDFFFYNLRIFHQNNKNIDKRPKIRENIIQNCEDLCFLFFSKPIKKVDNASINAIIRPYGTKKNC